MVRNLQDQKEVNYKDEQNLRLIEELKQQIAILKSKMLKKKNKIQLLKETQKTIDVRQSEIKVE